MDTTQRAGLMQRWRAVQEELIPALAEEQGALTPKLEKLIHTLEWTRIEEFVPGWQGVGRPPRERGALGNAFVAKAVLGLTTTTALIERLSMDRALKRICGFARWKKLPDEATFSRAFDEFAQLKLAERVHEAVVKEHLGEQLIGHLSRDGTAIEAREAPAHKPARELNEHAKPTLELKEQATPTPEPKERATPVPEPKEQAEPAPAKRGRPRRGEVREPKPTVIARQRTQALAPMIEALPTACDRGTKCNAQGYKVSWNGYKLHIDTADCGVPISALLTSASVHDSQTAIPLALMSASRVTNLYDLMDAAYCSHELRDHSRELGHVPLIDHNPRGGEKIEFAPHEAVRYNERTAAERTNARLKDEFGGNYIWVKGHTKVMSHLMFGLLALSVDQLMRLLQ